MTWWTAIKGALRVKSWRTLNDSSLSHQKPKMVLHNKKDPPQSISGFWTSLENIPA